MPTYDYRCNACNHEFELFQSMKDSPKRKCPACGKNALERLIGTGAAVLFKGSGFYETDYRSESYKKAAEAESKPTETKSDGKPEARVDAKSDSKGDTSKSESKSGSAKSSGKDGAVTKAKSSSQNAPKPASKSGGSKSPKSQR